MIVTLKGSVQHKQKKKNKSYSPSPIAIQMVQGALSNPEVKQHYKQMQLGACATGLGLQPADTLQTPEHGVTQAALQLCTAIANSCYSTSK